MYTKQDFQAFRASLKTQLESTSGEPLICDLYECENAPGAVTIEYPDGSTELHVAEACNVAAVVKSVELILSLPKSTVDCEDLSEVMLLRLDVLREYVRDLLPSSDYEETEAEKLIRWWAGFLKHPRGFVLAHRCLGDWEGVEGALVLDREVVKKFRQIPSVQEKDRAKGEYRNKPVKVMLPTVDEIDDFFSACRRHMELAIKQYG